MNYKLNRIITGDLMAVLETVDGVAETDGFEAKQTTVGTGESYRSVVVSDSEKFGMTFL